MVAQGTPDLQAVIDALPDGVVVHAPDGSIVAFNARAPEIVGLTPDQFRGRSAIDPLWRVERVDGSLMDQAELPTNIARLTGRPVVDGTFWLRVGDAPRRLITGSATPLEPGAPIPCAVVVSFRDVTVEWEASERAQRGDTLATLIELSLDGIVVIDTAERIQLANPAFARLLGVPSPTALVGRDFDAVIAPRERALFAQRLQELFDDEADDPTDTIRHRLALSLLTADGTTVPTELSMARMSWLGVPAIVCQVRDDSLRQRLEGELRQLQKVEAIGAFATGIAHDFGNVLQVIGGAARALERQAMEVAPSARELAAIDHLNHAVERGTEMTRHLLAFVRQTPRERMLIDAFEEIYAIGGMLRRLLPNRMGLTLDLATEGELLNLHRTELEQVLLNLVVNARNAMGEIGTILIRSVALPEHRLQIEVIDDGPGMSQVRPEASDGGVAIPVTLGAGLGLSIVRRIVDEAKGEFIIESGPNGTICRVILPTEPSAVEKTGGSPRFVGRIEV